MVKHNIKIIKQLNKHNNNIVTGLKPKSFQHDQVLSTT